MPNTNSVRGTNNKVTITTEKAFPYLDMEISWQQDKLHFGVHLKQNQLLKYLTEGSMHTKPCYKAIPEGVYNRLGKLTTLTEENKDKPISDIYPIHHNKLQQAGIVKGQAPTMAQINELATLKASKQHKSTKRTQQTRRERNIFFCVGYSTALTTPIHSIIKRLRDQFELKWLRVSMSYHRFSNFREILQQDLNKKITMDIASLDFQNLDCNCKLGDTPPQ